MNDVTRMGGFSGQLTPQQIQALLAARGMGGTSLTSTPITPTPVQTVPITPTPVINPDEPVRMPAQEDVDKWRSGVNNDISAGVVPNPSAVPPMAKPPAAFPSGGTAPIIATRPAIEQGPAGISLASNPIAPGWAGTVGIPGSPEEARGFDKGQKYNELLAGVGEIAKGLKPKAAASDLNTITPMSSQPNTSTPMAAEIMNTILQSKKRPRGVTLTG